MATKKCRPSKVPVSRKEMFQTIHRTMHQVFSALGMTLRDFQSDHGDMLTNDDVKLIWDTTQLRAVRLIKGIDKLEDYDLILKDDFDIIWSDE